MRKADNVPPTCAVVTQSVNLNFLEPSGSVQACNGTALPLPLALCVVSTNPLYEYLFLWKNFTPLASMDKMTLFSGTN